MPFFTIIKEQNKYNHTWVYTIKDTNINLITYNNKISTRTFGEMIENHISIFEASERVNKDFPARQIEYNLLLLEFYNDLKNNFIKY